ncbi:hypothetical protein PybrP1_007368 [[Pythium] brassicae (nom. inval.)]|nr:hypothetical protein PybrP1_007368 [[Pythium] brassicae (nom. inval.)]
MSHGQRGGNHDGIGYSERPRDCHASSDTQGAFGRGRSDSDDREDRISRRAIQLGDASHPSATTVLHTFSLNGNVEAAARILRAKRGDPNAVDSVRVRCLWLAHILGLDVTPLQTGCTPLHHAALLGRAELCALLLRHGGDANARAGGGSSPLHKAALGGHASVIRLLLDSGADRHILNNVRMLLVKERAFETNYRLLLVNRRTGARAAARRGRGAARGEPRARQGAGAASDHSIVCGGLLRKFVHNVAAVLLDDQERGEGRARARYVRYSLVPATTGVHTYSTKPTSAACDSTAKRAQSTQFSQKCALGVRNEAVSTCPLTSVCAGAVTAWVEAQRKRPEGDALDTVTAAACDLCQGCCDILAPSASVVQAADPNSRPSVSAAEDRGNIVGSLVRGVERVAITSVVLIGATVTLATVIGADGQDEHSRVLPALGSPAPESVGTSRGKLDPAAGVCRGEDAGGDQSWREPCGAYSTYAIPLPSPPNDACRYPCSARAQGRSLRLRDQSLSYIEPKLNVKIRRVRSISSRPLWLSGKALWLSAVARRVQGDYYGLLKRTSAPCKPLDQKSPLRPRIRSSPGYSKISVSVLVHNTPRQDHQEHQDHHHHQQQQQQRQRQQLNHQQDMEKQSPVQRRVARHTARCISYAEPKLNTKLRQVGVALHVGAGIEILTI